MTEKGYVALQALRFGDRLINPGEPVPHEAGRSYHQMLSLGQIALAPEGGAGPELPEGAHHLVLLIGEHAVFVSEDGEAFAVVFLGLQEPDEAARGTLELEPGQLAALVQFDGDPDAGLVTLDSLLWGDAAQRLVERVKTAAAGREAAEKQAAEDRAAAETTQAGLQWLTLLLSAVQATGEPLAEDQPGSKELAANGIHTREGAALLVAADPGNLIKLRGIGQATADKILAWLSPPPESEHAPA